MIKRLKLLICVLISTLVVKQKQSLHLVKSLQSYYTIVYQKICYNFKRILKIYYEIYSFSINLICLATIY